jgi:XTP/dITP diphosphohydrolase
VSRVLLATRNTKKLAELRRILHTVDVVGLDEVPPYPQVRETGLTFEENALLKARAGVRYAGLPTVADDSGIAVDALAGMPGVFSARWAGKRAGDVANYELVLEQLADVPDERLGAAFVCVAALALPDGRERVTYGRQPGRLVRQPRGDGGFGYDPVFVGTGQTRTNAQLSPAEKDAVSHRGQAFRAMAEVIAKELSRPDPTA